MAVSSVTLRQLHLAVGIAAVGAFLATGLYMHFALAHLAELEDFPRSLYRSGHIYLLYAALLNLVIGTYLTEARPRMRRNLQWAGSGLLLVSPVLFLYGFVVETPLGSVERTWTQWSIFGSTAGVVLHALFGSRAARRNEGDVDRADQSHLRRHLRESDPGSRSGRYVTDEQER
jgi:hypothetical protein